MWRLMLVLLHLLLVVVMRGCGMVRRRSVVRVGLVLQSVRVVRVRVSMVRERAQQSAGTTSSCCLRLCLRGHCSREPQAEQLLLMLLLLLLVVVESGQGVQIVHVRSSRQYGRDQSRRRRGGTTASIAAVRGDGGHGVHSLRAIF